ncbi:hypothetical protein P8C59_005757 [Phyllachora maydis]|uniref:Uncharacterized protein n=1 Tax=Phyllachora maydis TaxID=1825666 RepID=A0AAD9I6N0_9PEZI|nr:hypothetical protein P8C59_005757 [Phyllachora maydis]
MTRISRKFSDIQVHAAIPNSGEDSRSPRRERTNAFPPVGARQVPEVAGTHDDFLPVAEALVMLSGEPMRASLLVAPLNIKSRAEKHTDGAEAILMSSQTHSQMTPSTRLQGPQEDLPPSPPVFHNFLRAVFAFEPNCATLDSAVTLPLNEGDVVLVHSIHTNGWADGTLLVSGARGWLPTNYCEAYDPEEMSNLLNALLHFWDLLQRPAVNGSEMFGNEEYIKGIIAGVRYLLDQTNCLTRESAMLQRHEALRRWRKSLLAELSSLVKSAKQLQERHKDRAHADDVNLVVDDMILKAFRIVVKGVRFLDNVDEDARARVPAVKVMATVLEEASAPAAGTRAGGDSAQTTAAPDSRLLSAGHAHRLSVNRLSMTISHRLSLAGPSPFSHAQNLVSERLSSCHDTFLSHLGSFIGRLQLQSQSRPQLAFAVKQSASSGIQLLVVVDVVCAHSLTSVEALDRSRSAMYNRIRDLVLTARDVLTASGPEMDDVIPPHDNARLLGAATGCVKVTGECVAKTKWVIEKIGDFEYDFGSGNLGIDMDMSVLDAFPHEKATAADSATVDESTVSEDAPTRSTTSTANSCSPSRSVPLDVGKPLPDPPFLFLPDGGTNREDTAQGPSSPASLRPQLPPLPRLSTTLLPAEYYSPTERRVSRDSDVRSTRAESLTASSSGSASTYVSRDSESSLMSQTSMTSTRATTPDHGSAPRHKPSLSDLSATGRSCHADEVDDMVESKILERTFAHELVFNKEGQVTGGSLAALVERLTIHESTPDAVFVTTFYLTFRLFCTPREFTEALIDRFDYVGETPHIAGPVRLRTYNVFKGWLESHWQHETDHEALSLILPFARFTLGAVLPSAGRRLLELSDKVSLNTSSLGPRLLLLRGKTNTATAHYSPPDTPLPLVLLTKSQANLLASWKAGGSSPSIQDFDQLELARQLTIMQMAVFCRITPEELLGSKWTKRGGVGAPNVKAMSSFTTGLSIFVAETILNHEEIKKRAAIVKHWIKVANQCLALYNYDAVMAINCALTDTSIKRLRITWDHVGSKRKEMLKGLQSIVDLGQNYKTLRARLHDQAPPCLPFLGMFLTDLTFVDVGNPATKTTETGLTVINFDKHARTAKSIGELQRFQIPYRLADAPDLQTWLQAQLTRVCERDGRPGANAQAMHYRRSLMLEPRGPPAPARTPVEPAPGVFSWMRGTSSHPSHAAVPSQI